MQAIMGFSVNAEAKDQLIEKLEHNSIPIKDIIDRFHRTVFIFRDDASAVIATIHARSLDAGDMKALTKEEIKEVKAAAAPKKEAYGAKAAGVARGRYDTVHDMRIIRRPTNRASHKGWVTRGEYTQRRAEGKFSHRYIIDYIFHSNRHVESSECVSFEQARSAMYRKKKMILQKFIGAVIITTRFEAIRPIAKPKAEPKTQQQ